MKVAPYTDLLGELDMKSWIWTKRILPALVVNGECLEWHNAHSKNYGQVRFSINGRSRLVSTHRIAWEVANDELVPAGLGVLHHCDNPRCNNPAHLFVGTDKDNGADRHAKGRTRGSLFVKGQGALPNHVRGIASPFAKMTDATVREARGIYDSKLMGHKLLARKYGVAIRTMYLLVKRKSWSHIT